MPKIVEIDEMKKNILDNAIEVFDTLGYSNTTLKDIADKCHMGRTTLYKYYKNKDEIFILYLDYCTENIKSSIDIIVAQNQVNSIERIKDIIEIFLVKKEYKNLIFSLSEFLHNNNKDSLDKLFTQFEKKEQDLKHIFEDLLLEGINKKEIKPVNCKLTSIILFNLIEGALMYFDRKSPIDLKEYLNIIMTMITGLKN
ncbi:TetR/AcrR family transcriptional regulator [Desnuesiella massiliensis]|uniref:TetR/AcrR family transcriptional regulator n=1 Tax=Desnuesiella massiliensis TaxID=1650662 RepID=UPI0006E39223|nr:TetR/AcrR family transcriptional regulator [Desnuesiella massiliensis]